MRLHLVTGRVSVTWQQNPAPDLDPTGCDLIRVSLYEAYTSRHPTKSLACLLACRVPEECPAEIAALITACCSPAPVDQPNVNQVYQILHDAPQRTFAPLAIQTEITA